MSPIEGPNRTGWRLLVLATAFVASAALVMSPILFLRGSDAFHRLQRTNLGVCALRRDLTVRVKAGEDFLRQHPHGVAGISAETIRNGIDGQRRTINALSVLRCSVEQSTSAHR